MKTYTEILVEKKDLSKFADIIAKMTDNNEHMGTLLLAAELTEDKRLIEVVKAINNIVDYEKHNPISDYNYKIYKRVMAVGKKKYGSDWDLYIKGNM